MSPIAVFPNPTNNIITISGLSGAVQLNLLDIQGRRLFTKQTANYSEKIDTTYFRAGVYLLQIMQNNRIIKNIKVVKQ